MRYSRLKKRRRGQRYATFIVTVLLISGIIYVGSAGTIGKYISEKIAPVFSSFGRDSNNKGGNDKDPVITIPEPDEKEEKITETISASPLQMTAIQMGAFNDRENAANEADSLQKVGGAGYIIEDEYYRVLAMGYIDEGDAVDVRNRLKEDDTDSVLYTIKTSGASMEITAASSNVEAIKNAFSTWVDRFNEMEEIIIDLDSKKIQPADAYNRMEEYRSDFHDIIAKLEDIASLQEDNKVLSGLLSVYNGAVSSIDDILSSDSSNLVEISSKMKYTYIDMIMQYKNYMEQILNT